MTVGTATPAGQVSTSLDPRLRENDGGGVVVRFAPSPTGYLHLGNARTALFNWLFALQRGGRFILRFDDTDIARSRPEYIEGIREDLAWLGIHAAGEARQSERLARYDAIAADLRSRGLLYACYETAEELDFKRKRRRARGLPPVYDRAGLALTDADRTRLEAEGRKPHWRFRLPTDGDPHIRWTDLCRGEETVDLASLSDPVLIREDGSYLYTLPSVVDDADLAVTHVIRGEDHVTNTGVQIAILRALGAAIPAFGHHNLLQDASGEGLSKRTGALSLRSLREAGYEPSTVATIAVRIGTSENVEPVASVAALADGFDLADTSKSAARFDPADLDALNARTLHALPFEAVADRLAAEGIEASPAFWAAVAGNLRVFSDVKDLWQVVKGPIDPVIDPADRDFLAAASALLPDAPFDATTFATWTAAVKAATGRKGRGLFMPLRHALTGREHGPELAALLPLIGRPEALRRLSPA
jgi:glutamyl-tRNA synthetase